MWHKAKWVGHPLRLEFIRVGLLVDKQAYACEFESHCVLHYMAEIMTTASLTEIKTNHKPQKGLSLA